MAERWLIVGLGNPGHSYTDTRHNVGFWCINRLARKHRIELETKRLYALGRGSIGSAEVTLVKPRTYVNRSGLAVAPLLEKEAAAASHLLVICDDLDLPVGKLRLRPSGNHGGHNGLRSIITHAGSRDFPRIRIGIGRPTEDGAPVTDSHAVADYVLSRPSREERALLDEAVEKTLAAVDMAIEEGFESAMNQYNSSEIG